MSTTIDLKRRGFLNITAALGGGLLAGWYMPGIMRGAQAAQADAAMQPNAFVRITPDNWITVIVGHTEMGQGVSTVLPMLVAEELDADWRRVRWEQAPTAPAYAHPILHTQLTGGSLTTMAQYEPQRKAGAAVRAVLLAAAAKRWAVDPASLRTDTGKVIHQASGRSASYGELAGEAAGIAAPQQVTLKDPKDFKIIGKGLRRLDNAGKTNGSARFGMDVYLPGMLTALIARSPVFAGKLRSYDDSKARAVAGVVGVYQVPAGVAVVAKDFWSAKLGRDALVLDWDPVAGERLTSGDQQIVYQQLMTQPGLVARSDGDVAAAQKTAQRSISADYAFPYLTHATMEPLHAVIDFRGDSAEVWLGTQWPAGDQQAAAAILGLKPEQVKLNSMLTGGGFGRRSTLGFDIVSDAAHVAKAVRKPVKVIWTRDQDIKGGYYRPAAHSRISATLDAAGNVTSWSNRIAVQSIAGNTVMEKFIVKDGIDSLSVEGAADMPYAIPNVLVDLHTTHYQVPVLWMRSVGHSFNAFAVETFIDELATAAGQDPYQFRRALLKDKPRHLGVLDAVAKAANWSAKPAPGLQRGIVVHDSYGTYVALVLEASIAKNKELTIHRVVCAVDCGVAINADLVTAQVESSVVFGLTSALFGEITLNKGVVQQNNFDDYPLLRMYQTPRIETVLVPSAEHPGGVGEPIVPCIAPALANAIFAATGERVRSLPLKNHAWQIA
ncbi:xanthine dehydrogenase family protein molybdopterin-binding subunit [Janthinobacterium agaricidamnosum]|uniref:Tat (Twin-arginine translocation) pathway signal sequence domain protein n=1 Tax=Janthinobacterium agaricidamnosum NBRC 102515 = DSM 9628 TaxID=1349767 RepID=W0V3I8_9BURK|nr:xanthine dehydrogenase family protein molybdopterin-binding subunit [Janthinobacterium agaricidamnosum]CDG82170.1 tat (twin-arginine translocation) pathway signal sequence domain protein [Janthinobacterium agaricidamnosum NBRC 102515 = DSM 9628]